MQLEFEDTNDKGVVLSLFDAPADSPIPNVGDSVEVPDTTAGSGRVHYLTIKTRHFIYHFPSTAKLAKVVFKCQTK